MICNYSSIDCSGASAATRWTPGPDHRNTLTSASNLAGAIIDLGECAEVAVPLRTTLAAQIRTVGADEKGTLTIESQLASVLNRLGEHA